MAYRLVGATPMTSVFTYQGQLQQSGSPAQGLFDFKFTLYDVMAGGLSPAAPLTNGAIMVSNGVFSTTLDFGVNAFNGEARWLEVGVRTNGSGTAFDLLTPRQPVTPAPYALRSLSVSQVDATNVTGTIPDNRLSTNVALLATSPRFSGSVTADRFWGDGVGLTNLNPLAMGPAGTFFYASAGFSLASNPGIGANPQDVLVMDINDSGRPALVSVNYDAGTLSVMTNNGHGQFVLAASPAAGSAPISLTDWRPYAAGLPWVVCANYTGNMLSVLANNGANSFIPAFTLPVGSHPVSVISTDVNGDQLLDLVCANYSDNNLMVFTNDGRGGLALAATLSTGTGPQDVIAADVNGDGWEDLISANYDVNTLTIYTNNHHGGFALASSPTVGVGPVALAAALLNDDAALDLVCANSGANTLTVLTNDGHGGFAVAASPTVGNSPFSVVASHYLSGMTLDLVSANNGDNTLTILKNDGQGGFSTFATLPTGASPYAVAAEDLNNDGWQDLVSVNSGDNTLSVFTNSVAVSAAQLTGTVADARLSGNIARLNASQTFHGTQSIMGDVGIGTNAPSYPLHLASGAYCSPAGVFTSVSDRNLKENFAPIEPRDVLARVAALPITQWNYKSERDGVKHLGPMAQDFRAAFGLGDNERAIGAVDESGVALAAIQGLNLLLKEKDAQIRALTEKAARVEALEKDFAELKTLTERLLRQQHGARP